MTDIEESLRQRYPHVHPLMFARCLEKAKSDGELFDMLDSMPTEYPIVWDEPTRRWVHNSDVLQSKLEGKHASP